MQRMLLGTKEKVVWEILKKGRSQCSHTGLAAVDSKVAVANNLELTDLEGDKYKG